jgi:hypothetical protein
VIHDRDPAWSGAHLQAWPIAADRLHALRDLLTDAARDMDMRPVLTCLARGHREHEERLAAADVAVSPARFEDLRARAVAALTRLPHDDEAYPFSTAELPARLAARATGGDIRIPAGIWPWISGLHRQLVRDIRLPGIVLHGALVALVGERDEPGELALARAVQAVLPPLRADIDLHGARLERGGRPVSFAELAATWDDGDEDRVRVVLAGGHSLLWFEVATLLWSPDLVRHAVALHIGGGVQSVGPGALAAISVAPGDPLVDPGAFAPLLRRAVTPDVPWRVLDAPAFAALVEHLGVRPELAARADEWAWTQARMRRAAEAALPRGHAFIVELDAADDPDLDGPPPDAGL